MTHATPDSTIEQIFNLRYSCRSFKPDAVPRGTIERLLMLAQKTASWTNVQPWQVWVTSASATQRFREAMLQSAQADPESYDLPNPKKYEGVYQARRRECGLGLYGTLGIGKNDHEAMARQRLQNFSFFGAPHVAVITSTDSLGIYAAVDCGGYIANFMTVATSLGLASIAQASIASRAPVVHSVLQIPPDQKVICAISFGVANSDHPVNSFRTSRAALSEAVTWID